MTTTRGQTAGDIGAAVAPVSREEFDETVRLELQQRVALLTSEEYRSTAPSFEELGRRDMLVLGVLYVVLPILVALLVYA